MSTIKVTNIKNASTDDGGIAIDATGHVQVDGLQLPTAGALSNRNLIINGGMTVSQRATQVTGSTSAGYKTVDRFRISHTNLGTFTFDQDTNAPDGFANSFKASCTTADASPAASDQLVLQHRIEAQNLQHLSYGTSGAKSITLSFYVKSNKTGNASVTVLQSDNSDKLVSFQYSISTADTWEKKTVVIPGDTAGVINNDNGQGFQIEWWLNSGSNFTGGGHRSTWTTYAATDRNVSNLGIGGSTSDYWQITGVQLEVGEKATPFEHRSYGDELARCQRYYQQTYDPGVTAGTNTSTGRVFVSCRLTGSYADYCNTILFPVAMRATPGITFYAQAGDLGEWTGAGGDTTVGFNSINRNGFASYAADASTAGQAGYLYGHYIASAEL